MILMMKVVIIAIMIMPLLIMAATLKIVTTMKTCIYENIFG